MRIYVRINYANTIHTDSRILTRLVRVFICMCLCGKCIFVIHCIRDIGVWPLVDKTNVLLVSHCSILGRSGEKMKSVCTCIYVCVDALYCVGVHFLWPIINAET